MVLSNTKLKRKKREEAAAVAVLDPPPDSNATSSVANDLKGGSPALLPAKKKKLRKSKAVNGDAEDGTAGSVSEDIRDPNSIPQVFVDGNVLEGEPVQKSKKTRSASVVGLTDVTLTHFKGEGKALSSVEENNAGVAAAGLEETPEAKIRKKPRWGIDENGNRVKPQRVGGDGDYPSNGDQGSVGDASNGLVEKCGDPAAAVPDSVNNGDRIHQGDEPWLQSNRSKKKKKLTDRWGKRVSDVEASGDDHVVAPEIASSTEEKVDPKKVMVGGMPYYVSEDDIHEFFQECGTIAELDCMTFSDTGKFKGIAFITFRTEEAAKRALTLDGADMGGRFLKIEICKIRHKEPARKEVYKEPPKKYDGCLSAYVGNLSWDVTEKELRKFFKGCKIDSVRFAVNKETGEFRGFGHVDFADDQSIETAMKLDQMPFLDRPLKIAYSVPQKKNPGEARGGQSGDRKGCFTCGEEGHMSYNCPKKL